MLEDVASTESTTARVADGAVQRHTLLLAVVDAAVEDVVVVKGNVARLELDDELVREDGLKGARVALGIRAGALVRAGHKNERVVLVQGKVVLGVEARVAETLHLLLGRRLGRDVVTVPAQVKLALGADQHVEELHDKLLVLALKQVLDNAKDRVGEVELCEDVVARHVGVHHVLDTPDALLGVEFPGGELLADGADVRPLASTAEGFGLLAGFAQDGELLGRHDGLDDNEAVALQVSEVRVGLLGGHCVGCVSNVLLLLRCACLAG